MSLYNILIDKVKEQGIVYIIIEYKKDMDFINIIDKRTRWIKHKQQLEKDLEQSKYQINKYNRYLKNNCKHKDITHYNYWDNSNSYNCNICLCDVQIHDDFNFRDITKVIEL